MTSVLFTLGRYGGQNALGWANERADDASAQLLIELHMVAD